MSEHLTNNGCFDFRSSRGVRLFARCWAPSGPPVGAVGIVHGLGDHCSRYGYVADLLAESGFLVLAYDQPGHGQSPGPRGHIRAFSWLLDDMGRMVDELRARVPTSPVFLYGHSLGGSLVLNYLLRRQVSLSGAIVSSPLLLPTVQPPAWKRAAARTLNYVLPPFRFSTGIQATDLSHDPEAVAAYEGDPLVHRQVSARLAVQMLAAGRWALQHAAELAVPTLLQHGDADPITSYEASAEFARRAGSHCTLKTWPGMFHELHWEQNRDEVMAAIVQWMQQTTCDQREVR